MVARVLAADGGPARPWATALWLAFAACAGLGAGPAGAQTPNAAGIYTCTDSQGNKLTSDRPIAACTNREQRVLNGDGSVRRIVPPTPTAEERIELDAQEARRAAERRAQADAVRRDRNLLQRYPDEATHQKAREAALDDIRQAIARSQVRLKDLAAERKPLLAEAEFYLRKPMPPLLKQQLDANDASTDAQTTLVQNQQVELTRINASYDVELARLRKLWAGTPPGSLGAVPKPASAPTAPAASNAPAPAGARPGDAAASSH